MMKPATTRTVEIDKWLSRSKSKYYLTVHKRKKQELSEMEKWGWYVILGSSDAFLCIIYGFWFVKKF